MAANEKERIKIPLNQLKQGDFTKSTDLFPINSPLVRGPLVSKASGATRDAGREVNRRGDSFRKSPIRQRGRPDPVNERSIAMSDPDLTTSSFTMEEIQQIFSVLLEVTKGRTEITLKNFEEAIAKLEARGFCSLKNTSLQSRMFELFDSDGNRSLDSREFIAGLSLLCKGTPEEKLKLTFDLYDKDGSGTLNRAELFQGLKSAHEHALALQQKQDLKPTDSRRHAISKIRDCVDDIMRAVDSDGNSTIDFEEFKAWGMRSPFINLASVDLDLGVAHSVGEAGPSISFATAEVLHLKILEGKNFAAFGKGVTDVYCSVKLLNFEGNELEKPVFETKRVSSDPPVWGDEFTCILADVLPQNFRAFRFEVFGKTDVKESTLLGVVVVDRDTMEDVVGKSAEFQLLGEHHGKEYTALQLEFSLSSSSGSSSQSLP